MLRNTTKFLDTIILVMLNFSRFRLISGFSIWHFTLDIVAVYMFIVVLGPTLVTLALTWMLTMVSNRSFFAGHFNQ